MEKLRPEGKSSQRSAPDAVLRSAPYGWMIARTSWDANCVMAEMKINEPFFGNHQHLDGGSFQLYHKGPLAIDAGAYDGSSGGYNSPHNKNFFKRTIAHNSLLVYNPDEKFACSNYGGEGQTPFADNDGGQRMPGDRWETCRSFGDLLSKEYTTGKVLAQGFGSDAHTPDYSYLKGDITQAYTDKVKEAKRSFFFLNLQSADVPAALIVFDKVVSSNPTFQKFWLLHSIEEPAIAGSQFTIKRTKKQRYRYVAQSGVAARSKRPSDRESRWKGERVLGVWHELRQRSASVTSRRCQ